MDTQRDLRRDRLHDLLQNLLQDLLHDLLLLTFNFSFFLCFWLLAALLCLLASAALAYGAAGAEGFLGLLLLSGLSGLSLLLGLSLLSELSRFSGLSRRSLLLELPRLLVVLGLSLPLKLSAAAQRGGGRGLLGADSSWLQLELGRVFLDGAQSLLTLLAALWDSLAGSIRRVGELLATFLVLVASRAPAVASRATAVSIRLWLRHRLTFKLLCSATVVFISVHFLAAVCHSGAQSLGTPSVTLRDSLTSPVFRVTDLLAAFLAPVSSGAIAVPLLLWGLCQMVSELLCSIAKVFSSICFLVSSLARSLLSVCLMGSQYLSMLLTILWDLLSGLILGVTNVLVMVLVFLLWLPLQLALMLLSLVTQLLTSIFYLGVNILGVLVRIAFLTVFVLVIYCNQEVLWVLKGRVRGYSRRLQPALWQLCQVAVETGHRAISSQPWRRLVGWLLTTWSQAGRRMNQRREQLDAGQEPGTSWWKAPRKQQLNSNAEGTPDNDPWALLKEQEERKKCVICQDQTKTVLLLPCRHLCLCQECTEVLLQQDIHQRICPLCRQMIQNTVNVYL